MTTYFPIDFPFQYYVSSPTDYSNYVIKCYQESTTTPIQMSTDSVGGALVDSIALNANGLPEVSGAVVIPHIDQNYKLVMYPTQAAADSNTGAVWSIDGIKIGSTASSGVLTDVASAATINLNSTSTNYFNVTGTTNISTITLAEGSQVWVKFAGALTLTNSASLICLGGANVNTAAGDIAVFRGEGSSVVRMLGYARASGALVLPEGAAPATGAGEGALYTKDTGGQPELFFREESSGDEVQITSGGALNAGGAGLQHPGYNVGKYYSSFLLGANQSSASLAANTLVYLLMFVDADETFDRVAVRCESATSLNCRLGLYSVGANGLPDTLITDFGTFASSSTGNKEITISETISAGVYYLAMVTDATANWRFSEASTFNSRMHFLGINDIGSGSHVGYSEAFTYGALPASSSATSPLAQSPIIWLRNS